MSSIKKIISEHIRYAKTIIKLAKSDLIKTYKGTALGWSWALIRPAMTLGVYYFAFSVGLKLSAPVEGYSYFLWIIAGVVPWFYIRDILTAGAGSIRKYRFLVTKIKCPVSTIPTFVSLSHIFVNTILMGIVMILFILSGHKPDIYWLQIPFYIFIMFMFFSVWSLFSAILSTFSKDFFQLVKSFTIMLFWISGVMYDVTRIDSDIIRKVMLFNPVTVLINGFRNSFIYKEWFWENMNETCNLMICFVVLTGLAVFAYSRLEREIVDVL